MTVQTILQTSEASIAESLEKTLLTEPVELRAQEIVSYAEEATGNPVRQFEAYDILKDNFTDPQTILLTEELKDKATQNLTDRISEIPDANTRSIFADLIIGSEPQDLKAIIQIEEEVAPPQNAGIVEVLPIVQKVEDIKANIVENIVEEFKDKPEELKTAEFFDNPALSKTPDVVDIQVAQAVVTALESSPEVQPAVIEVAKQEETKIIDTFVENISTQTNFTEIAAESLNPIPEALATLIDLREQLPPSESSKIDIAIHAEVALIEDHLVNHVTDPTTFETYLAQLMQDPSVAAVVEQVGGQAFKQAIEQKTQIIDQQVTSDEAQLTTTVAQIQQEVFWAPVSSPSTVEQSLPQQIQEEIAQIKQEVPSQQIPAINVAVEISVSTTVDAQPIDTSPIAAPVVQQPQASPPAQAQSAPQESAPTPAVIEIKPPETQSEPAAPAVPGL